MAHWLLLAVMMFLANLGWAEKEALPLPVTKLSENTYVVYGEIAQLNAANRGFNSNAGFVITEDGVVVIDVLGTPLLARRLLASIRQVTDQPVRLAIVTHNHPDHYYGVVEFKRAGALLVAHKGLQKYLGSEVEERSVAYRREMIPEDMEGFQAVGPHVVVDFPPYSGQEFRFGRHVFTVYDTGRHHSHGDLVVYQQPEGVLWISDLAFNGRTTFMGDGSSKLMIEGIDWVRKEFADVAWMVPGHGVAQEHPFPMLEQTRSYAARLRETMGKAVAEGVDMQEAMEHCDFPDWHGVLLYRENHKRNCHFVYREMEEQMWFGAEP